jgi:hypothetical protein
MTLKMEERAICSLEIKKLIIAKKIKFIIKLNSHQEENLVFNLVD